MSSSVWLLRRVVTVAVTRAESLSTLPIKRTAVTTLFSAAQTASWSLSSSKRLWYTQRCDFSGVQASISLPSSSSSLPTTMRHRTSFVKIGLLGLVSASAFPRSSVAFAQPPFLKPHDSTTGGIRDVRSFSTSSGSGGSSSTEEMATLVVASDDMVALKDLASRLDNSWPRMLRSETPENLEKSLERENLRYDDDAQDSQRNQQKRPVYNGHYVLVKPTPLSQPRLVLWSKSLAKDVFHLKNEQIDSEEFINWVTGNLVLGETWATPYALSIMGTRYTNNCPYGTGNGYGDGRAISIGEVYGQELQLKGAGRTPFARGADGRAVLRSSIREFLASEAMFHLNVSTTRALSLAVSQSDTILRPWYTDDAVLQVPSLDDPRLAKYPEDQRKQLIQQIRHQQKADPNVMQREPAAITCRVAPSFMRVGHIDLFARRANRKSIENVDKTNSLYDTSTLEWKELEDIIWHACYREFKSEAYDPYFESKDIASAATVLLQQSAQGISKMVADWIRVGFAQGNFNADNCLVAGRTMDYGPFGWMEEYYPLFAKWTGSGQHFGFLNQPSAGFANYQVLVESVVPVICAARGTVKTQKQEEDVAKEFLEPASQLFQSAMDSVFREKLGFQKDHDVGDDIWGALESLLRKSRTDYTLLFRELTYLMRDFPDLQSSEYQDMMTQLEGDDSVRSGSSPFYETPLDSDLRKEWIVWIEQWRSALAASHEDDVDGKEIYGRMRQVNPKFVLREWMLVDAYMAANQGQEAELFNLYAIIQRPYDEGSDHEIRRYYRRAPDEALTTGGTAFMS